MSSFFYRQLWQGLASHGCEWIVQLFRVGCNSQVSQNWSIADGTYEPEWIAQWLEDCPKIHGNPQEFCNPFAILSIVKDCSRFGNCLEIRLHCVTMPEGVSVFDCWSAIHAILMQCFQSTCNHLQVCDPDAIQIECARILGDLAIGSGIGGMVVDCVENSAIASKSARVRTRDCKLIEIEVKLSGIGLGLPWEEGWNGSVIYGWGVDVNCNRRAILDCLWITRFRGIAPESTDCRWISWSGVDCKTITGLHECWPTPSDVVQSLHGDPHNLYAILSIDLQSLQELQSRCNSN